MTLKTKILHVFKNDYTNKKGVAMVGWSVLMAIEGIAPFKVWTANDVTGLVGKTVDSKFAFSVFNDRLQVRVASIG